MKYFNNIINLIKNYEKKYENFEIIDDIFNFISRIEIIIFTTSRRDKLKKINLLTKLKSKISFSFSIIYQIVKTIIISLRQIVDVISKILTNSSKLFNEILKLFNEISKLLDDTLNFFDDNSKKYLANSEILILRKNKRIINK